MNETQKGVMRQLNRRLKMPVWKPEMYSKLCGNREVRVLIIKPGSIGAEVEVSFKTVCFDDESAIFEALSYTWGIKGWHVPRIRCFIYLKGHKFDVTANLAFALLHLRHP